MFKRIMNKRYTSAPLPFQGQKRRFSEEFRKVLDKCSDDTVFVDLFGGSGLLSHIAKYEKPNSTVIYNDFDNYCRRLKTIPMTNMILQELRGVLCDYPRKIKLNNTYKEYVLQILRKWHNKGIFIDWITLSSSLLFSANYITSFDELLGLTLYNRIRVSDYNYSEDYLLGIDVVNCDYKLLFAKYKKFNNVVFLVDPPYLNTDTKSYSSNLFWRLTDYLDVLSVINGTNFVYFTSDKSNIIELCEWMGNINIKYNPFEGSQRRDLKVTLSKKSTYTDTMLFKWKTTTT